MPRARRKPYAPQEGEPNEQQRRHAVYLKPEWQAGVDRRILNVIENRLRELEYLGVLSARQREAGELFEADYWRVFPDTSSGDSSQPRIGGKGHETEAEAKRARAAAGRIKAIKVAAGPYYVALRQVAVFRERVKLAAVILPGILDKAGDVYELPVK